MNQDTIAPRVPRPRHTPRPLLRPSIGLRTSSPRRGLPLPTPPPRRRSKLPPPPPPLDDDDPITGRFHRSALVPVEVGSPRRPAIQEVDPELNDMVDAMHKERRRNRTLCALALVAAGMAALWSMTQLLDPNERERPYMVEAPSAPEL